MNQTIRRWRDAWLSKPSVRARLARLPIGRAISDRHATRLFAAITGFAGAQMIAAACELGVLDRLATGAMSVAEIAAFTDLPLASARALAVALEGTGLCERVSGDRLALGVDGLVVATDPAIRAMIAHHRLLYEDWRDPVAMLRRPGSGGVAAFWPYLGAGDAESYSALMAATAGMAADTLLGLHDFGRYRRVMDVGGGSGVLAIGMVRRWPALDVTVADLPPAAAVARDRLQARRIEIVGLPPEAPLPRGADATTLLRILHDHDDEAARALLARVAAALPLHGRVVIAEPMRHGGRDPVSTYFGAYFVAMGSGRLRAAGEIAALCRSAGLVPMGRLRHRFLLDVMIVEKRH